MYKIAQRLSHVVGPFLFLHMMKLKDTLLFYKVYHKIPRISSNSVQPLERMNRNTGTLRSAFLRYPFFKTREFDFSSSRNTARATDKQ